MEISEDDYLAHYGILRRSGRYPWGSGGPEFANNRSFLDYVAHLKSQGLSEKEIATGIGSTIAELRAAKSVAKNEEKQAQISNIIKYRNNGMSNVAIGKKMGLPESTVRALQKDDVAEKASILTTTANRLEDAVKKKTYLDVGSGVQHHVGVSVTTLNNAIAVLKEKGYEVHDMSLEQLGTGLRTKFKILTLPGVTRTEVFKNREKIEQFTDFSKDDGRTWFGIKPPLAINPSRVEVVYKEQGGDKADGVMYLRRGVKDISLGASSYAQVRVAVGNGHYLKGMAMYKDDMPDGVDILFNTNKSDTGHKLDALKPVERNADGTVNKENPFGAQISHQIIERASNGKEVLTSAMNIVNEEGDWGDWADTLSSQFLSKQTPSLARDQLNMTYERRVKEFNELNALTNPTVKKKLLEDFGDDSDSAAVHLKAAALNQNQRTQVILPLSRIKPTEIYAPNFTNGERVVLVRHPHGGRFEIPELIVNNNLPEGKRVLGTQPKDAVGIHHTVAEHLSGADFDGDFVVVIPNNSNKIKHAPGLDGLKNFDPKGEYKAYEGMPEMTTRQKGIEMGDVSNLITDMTIKGASTSELARAVRHSMVVIDAEKHHLNYKLSAEKNGIKQLKQKYQGGGNRGASTIISRANSELRVPHRKARSAGLGGPIDRVTGRREFEPTGLTTKNKAGETIPSTTKTTKLAEATDARTLLSGPDHEGTPMERLYADHSNKLKDLANRARLESINTVANKRSPSAAKAYHEQVTSLNSKLALAERNAPLERQAQVIANGTLTQRRHANPNMDEATIKKVKSQSLDAARNRTGAKKNKIEITDDEWAAIQAGAISPSKLRAILDNADMEIVKKHATPRKVRVLSKAQSARAQSMLDNGFTRAQVAAQLGVSLSTLDSVTDVKGVE